MNLNLAAEVEFMKMSTAQEKAQCVSWFIKTKSDIQGQRNFTCKYGRGPPAGSTILCRIVAWGPNARQFLNLTFSNRWIGRDGPILWLTRSSDFTPLNFCCCEVM